MLGEISALYRGLVLGLVIAAPVGPVGLLCIRRTLEKGMFIGLATGIGAAMADTIFGGIAVLGVSVVLAFIHEYASTIRLVGGFIVLYTAWHTWRDRPQAPQPSNMVARVLDLTMEKVLLGTVQAAISGFIITLTNPLTLFGTMAVVATFGEITQRAEADVLIAGIFLGSALWWFFLSGGISLLRHHCSESRILTVNRITALGLSVLAGWAILSGIHGYMK